MKRFVINVLLFFMAAFVLPAILAFSIPSNPDGFYKVYLLKEKRADTISSPKILVCGGSDILHAIDTKLIQDSLHRNVVNMGLTAALGYDVVVNDALKYSKKGDIVLLSMGAFANSIAWGGVDEIPVLVDYNHKKLFELRWENIKQLGRGVYCLLKMKTKYTWLKVRGKNLSQTYSLSEFDENGDYKKTYQTDYKRQPVNRSVLITPEQHSFIESVCKRIRMMEEKGCRVFIIPETIEKETYQVLAPRISAIHSVYVRNGINYLFPPDEPVVPDSMIFNSQYHVNYRGTAFYSNLIVTSLKKHLTKNKDY